MNTLDEFCDKKCLPDNFRKAFITYCKSLYGSKFNMKDNGETIKNFIAHMTDEQLNAAWMDFIMDFKATVPTEMTSVTSHITHTPPQ